jgi:DNA (cytosine-5)-methyltransferase 1
MSGDDHAFLRLKERSHSAPAGTLHSVDLFCGAGGLSLGAEEAAASLGWQLKVALAADMDAAAANCFEANFEGTEVERRDLAAIFDIDGGSRLSAEEAKLRRRLGGVDLLLGGPPCQGHSDLNNYSRRDDPKNRLYRVMSRAARVLRPDKILIENVPGVAHDRGRAFQQTAQELEQLGYAVSSGVVDGLRLGVPQSRKRLVLIGTLKGSFDIASVESAYAIERPRDVRWAIEDLQDSVGDDIVNQPANTSSDNRARIKYLFENKLWDLPDEQRPPCHRGGGHSYKSVYGRLRYDKPSQTITSGFYSVCMGRYVHPSRQRTLTAHEAARLQFFPDYFDFSAAGKRTSLARVIGNAVPPKLSFPFIREMLRDN